MRYQSPVNKSLEPETNSSLNEALRILFESVKERKIKEMMEELKDGKRESRI